METLSTYRRATPSNPLVIGGFVIGDAARKETVPPSGPARTAVKWRRFLILAPGRAHLFQYTSFPLRRGKQTRWAVVYPCGSDGGGAGHQSSIAGVAPGQGEFIFASGQAGGEIPVAVSTGEAGGLRSITSRDAELCGAATSQIAGSRPLSTVCVRHEVAPAPLPTPHPSAGAASLFTGGSA